MAILSSKGVLPDMVFTCCDCGEKTTGQQVIDDTGRLTIVRADREHPELSVFRCECCQDEHEERYGEEAS